MLKNEESWKMFLGKYTEIQITYDNSNLGVEVDGFTREGFTEGIMVQYDINNPEDYAHGVFDILRQLFPSINLTLTHTNLLEQDGWHLGDEFG